MTSNSSSNRDTSKQDLLPLDAAVLIVIDTDGGFPRVLMGLRNENLAFMPGKFVFPGGRTDPCDEALETPDDIADDQASLILQGKLEHSNLQSAKALPLTAIRETYEETGVLIGSQEDHSIEAADASWSEFLGLGVVPYPSALKYCARAITPENRVRRYDTRFFCVEAKHIAKQVSFEPGELQEICWVTFEEALDTKLATITRRIILDIQDYVVDGRLFSENVPIPFYYSEDGQFKRDIIG